MLLGSNPQAYIYSSIPKSYYLSFNGLPEYVSGRSTVGLTAIAPCSCYILVTPTVTVTQASARPKLQATSVTYGLTTLPCHSEQSESTDSRNHFNMESYLKWSQFNSNNNLVLS